MGEPGEEVKVKRPSMSPERGSPLASSLSTEACPGDTPV